MPIKAKERKVKREVTGITPKPQKLFSHLKGKGIGDKILNNSEAHRDGFVRRRNHDHKIENVGKS